MNKISTELQTMINKLDGNTLYSTKVSIDTYAIIQALLVIAYAIGEVATAIYRTQGKE